MEALRRAKTKIDVHPFQQFEEITNIIIIKSSELGIDIFKTKTSIDFKDISIKGGKVCLHDEKVPFRLKGKGSKD